MPLAQRLQRPTADLLPTVNFLLSTVYCLLPTVYCLLLYFLFSHAPQRNMEKMTLVMRNMPMPMQAR